MYRPHCKVQTLQCADITKYRLHLQSADIISVQNASVLYVLALNTAQTVSVQTQNWNVYGMSIIFCVIIQAM